MSKHITVTHEITLSDEFLSDVLVTAFDSNYNGCWYWARPHEVEEGQSWLKVDKRTSDSIWISVTIADREGALPVAVEGNPDYAVVDHDVIVRGIQRAFETPANLAADFIAVRAAATNGDAGDIDSSAADVIVQLGLFGSVIYG